MQNISSGMCRKQNFEIVFEFKSGKAVLVGFILVGKVLRNAFTILRLDKTKGRVVDQDFHGNF